METKEIEIFRLSEIIARSMREELSDDERRVLDEWLAQDERHRTMYAAFGREEVLAEQVRLRQTIDWQGDCRMFMSRRKSWRRRKLLYRSLRYAALFILLLSGATVWWVNSSRTDDLEQGSRLTDTRHRAFLTLAGGEQIVLSQNDTLTVPVLSQKGANIEIRENQITYSTVSAVNDNIPCNTLTKPRGREYLLTLSDGTRVWLSMYIPTPHTRSPLFPVLPKSRCWARVSTCGLIRKRILSRHWFPGPCRCPKRSADKVCA